MADINAVFIGGCDRSGTTMLGSMLGASPECFTTPESQFKLCILLNADHLLRCASWTSIAQRLQKLWPMRLWSIPNDCLIAALTFYEPQSGPDLLRTVLQAFLNNSVASEKKRIWIDHTPNNFTYMEHLIKAFPTAKFVHIVRDGRAVAASIKKLPWGPCSFYGASSWWMENLAPGFAAELVHPRRVCRIRYEDIVDDPMSAMNLLTSFLGLAYTQKMTEGGSWRVPSYTAKNHELVGGRPDRARADAWRTATSLDEIAIFERRAGTVLQLLGYEHATTETSMLSRKLLWFWRAQEVLMFVMNGFRQKWRRSRAK